jgi:hypothetical protein
VYRKPRGIKATLATVELIRRAIVKGSRSQVVRRRAIAIVQKAGVPPKDYRGELRALFDYCSHKLRYTRDPATAELVHSPLRLLGEIDQQGFTAGDCDDQTVLLGSLAASIGLPVAIRIVGAKPDQFAHVHLRVRVGQDWIPADLTAMPQRGLGFEPRAVAERVFALDGKELTGMRHYVGSLHGLGEGVFSETDIARHVGALGYSRYDIEPDGTLVGFGPAGLGELGFFDSIVGGITSVGKGIVSGASAVANIANTAAPIVSVFNPVAGAQLAAAGQVGRGVVSAFQGGGQARRPGPRPAPRPGPRKPPSKPVRRPLVKTAPQAAMAQSSAPTASPSAPEEESFLSKHKWPLLLGGAAVLGGGAFLMLRKRGKR